MASQGPQPTSRGGGTGNGYPGGPRPDAWREPATFAVRCGWAMAARRLPRLPLANLPTTSSTRPAPTTPPPQRASATGRRGREAIGEGDEGPETRRDACLLTAAKTPVRPTPPRTGAAPARSSGRTPPPGGPTPSPHRGFALGTSPSLAASASEPSQEAAEGGRRARPGPACLDNNQPRPGTAGSRPRSGYPSAAAREPAHRGLARAPGRPGGPGARSPAAARNTAGRSCSEAGNVLHGRTKRPRGEGQRARVVEKGALPARKANGNGGKRPSAHGLPAVRRPSTNCGHSQLEPLPPTDRHGRGKAAPRPPDRDRHGAAASPRASRSLSAAGPDQPRPQYRVSGAAVHPPRPGTGPPAAPVPPGGGLRGTTPATGVPASGPDPVGRGNSRKSPARRPRKMPWKPRMQTVRYGTPDVVCSVSRKLVSKGRPPFKLRGGGPPPPGGSGLAGRRLDLPPSTVRNSRVTSPCMGTVRLPWLSPGSRLNSV
ncbi:basic proline-rich protein-like [Penaeus indicus]|uniref:basic proline-rich protein-like n=1 Tax=Penaeus indicus TaxID=29960 RepID=UPI00300C9E73